MVEIRNRLFQLLYGINFPDFITAFLTANAILHFITRIAKHCPKLPFSRAMATTHALFRWAVPAGLGITTVVWSTVNNYPEQQGTAVPFRFALFPICVTGLGISIISILIIVFQLKDDAGPQNQTPRENNAVPHHYSDSMGSQTSKKLAADLEAKHTALEGDAGVWRGAQIGVPSSTYASVAPQPSSSHSSPLTRPTADDTHISMPTPLRSEGQGAQLATGAAGPRDSRRPSSLVAPFGDPDRYFDEAITSPATEDVGHKAPTGKV